MTLKEELEILRGEPIQVFTGDPMDIPCIETSDPERLCKHPVVSVNMITYNHEPYIRQAIEGVMMQKTDFEFELVIGEDCSTDKTREICFEYQKRYPDKIRVLWCDHNLYRNPHPAGDNGTRNMAHCRGEFIAFCEGDDYWIDPLKLQKQVDIFKRHIKVSICFSGTDIYRQEDGVFDHYEDELAPSGLVDGKFLSKWLIFEKDGGDFHFCQRQMETAGMVFRLSAYNKAKCLFPEMVSWRLRFGDIILKELLVSVGDAYYIRDIMNVYRTQCGGVTSKMPYRIGIDGDCVFRPYFGCKKYQISQAELASIFRSFIVQWWNAEVMQWPYIERIGKWLKVLCNPLLRSAFLFKKNLFSYFRWILPKLRFLERLDSFYQRHICL